MTSPTSAPRLPLRATVTVALLLGLLAGCRDGGSRPASPVPPDAGYQLKAFRTHNRFTRDIEPVLSVPSGSVVRVETVEASDGQIRRDSGVDVLDDIDFDPVHPLTGPILIEDAEPGDTLAVTIHRVETAGWGWAAIVPGFGFLSEEFDRPWLRTFEIERDARSLEFAPGIRLPIRPFAGVMGVAPDTDERLSTIPPRANGGNMDNPYLTAGTTVYLPVFVPGALFSIGDAHVTQGLGEVSGTGVEGPMTFELGFELFPGGRNGRGIEQPEYETDEFYAVTAFAPTLDEAARSATRFMIDYLVAEHGLERDEAYVLCSLAGDLQIAEVVDVPHVLVAMHMPKAIFQSSSSSP